MAGAADRVGHKLGSGPSPMLFISFPVFPRGVCSARSRDRCGTSGVPDGRGFSLNAGRRLFDDPGSVRSVVCGRPDLGRIAGGRACGAAAQELYGSVVGTVQDGSGGRIPGATIEIVNRETNLVLTAVSNETGAYTFTNVLARHVRREGDAPGVQGVRAAAGSGDDGLDQPRRRQAGSRPAHRIGHRAVGAALLKTDKADTGSAFSVERGRGPSAAGVPELSEPARPRARLDAVGVSRTPRSTRPHARCRPRSTARIATPTAPAWTARRISSRGFRITRCTSRRPKRSPRSTSRPAASRRIRGSPAARRSRSITKSGTNQLQGSGFGFYTDQNLRAQTYFAKRNNTPKRRPITTSTAARSAGRSSRTGCSTSAPSRGSIEIPRGSRSTPFPPRRCARGDFSEALNTNGSLQLIYDPRTGDIDGRGRTAFAGNVIPADRINAIARRINEFYPLPNGPGNSEQLLQGVTSARSIGTSTDVKINWNRSPGHQIWGKIGVMDATVSNLQKLSFDGGGLGKTKTWVGDDRPDLHAEPIVRHRHDRRLFAPRPVGVRARTTAPTTAWSSACPARTVRTSGRAACRSGATA